MQNCNFTDDDFQETVPTNVTTEIENKQSEITLKGTCHLQIFSKLFQN